MSDVRDTLNAGGMVPVSAKLGKDDAVDVVVARAYAHAVLPGRTVIRLTAESVAAGDDLEMATLGFGAGEDRGPVAKERKRPLGFPGWALVHDPKNARYALDVVKEFKKQARKAKSKPGHAKEGIDAIAEKLGKSVPHFLPSFFEEAGRAFLEHGAQTFAAAMFGKAREAEAVHALEVDEQHRVDGFLEFALAGAVTTKALTQYAKDLAEHHQPAVAYGHFRQLCLQRTLGGMPPWSGMAKELRKLAKAAKLDPDAEDATFIAEIIGSPALGKAAAEFWRAYQQPITALGKRSASARGALLDLFPTGTAHSVDLDDAWLDLVEATGAVDALVGNSEPAPSGGRAAWFDKLTQHLARSWRNSTISARAFALLRRMAPALIADGAPITCAGRWGGTDLDLVELALELGVPVAPAAQNARVDVDDWAKHATEPERGRDPIRAAAHAAIGPLVMVSVAQRIGSEPFDSTSRGKHGFLAAKRAWLEGVIARAEQGALPAVEDALATINGKVKPETFAELPDLHARFAAIDPAPALARTLRIGIVDELGWPALEEAALELNPDGKVEITLHGGPPALVLATKTRALAVGPAGRLAEHDLVIPPRHELVTARFIGGQFLIVIKEGYKARGYWSSAPHDIFDSEVSTWHVSTLVARAAVLGDGAWIEANAAMRAGERKLAFGANLAACDGTTAWIAEWKDGNYRWREVTPSGELGRFSWPAFIEAGLESDQRVDATSYVLPALGSAGGLVGARVRYRGDTNRHNQTERTIEMLDGARFVAPAGLAVSSLVRLPGGGAPRPLIEETAWRQGTSTTILAPDGAMRGSKVADKDRRYLRGQVCALPPTFWHHMIARDEAGSRRIHDATDADARALMAAVPVQQGTPEGVAHPEPTDIAGLLPEVTQARLRRGVTGLAVMAVQFRIERDRLARERAPGQASARPSAPGHDDRMLMDALSGWSPRQWAHDGKAWVQIERTIDVFTSDDRSDRSVRALPPARFSWLSWAVRPWPLAFIATAIGTPADQRAALAELLAHLCALPPVHLMRVFDAEGTFGATHHDFELCWRGGNAYALRGNTVIGGKGYRVLEYAPDGKWQPLDGLTVVHPVVGEARPSAEQIAAVVSAVAEGKTSWSAEAAARLAAATGLTLSEATFLVAGCPKGGDRSANFLAKELREQLGLKAAQAAVARDAINALAVDKRLAAVDAAARAASVLDGGFVDALAAAWNRIVGARIAIPEELIADADRELQAPMQPAQALAMIGNAAEAPELAVDGTWALGKDGGVIRAVRAEPLVGQDKAADDRAVFSLAALATVAMYVPFVYAELPVGHPLRAQAAVALARVKQRLANPALWFEAGRAYLEGPQADAFDRVVDALGGEPLTGFDAGYRGVSLPGAAVVRYSNVGATYRGDRVDIVLHPATLDAKSSPVVGKLVAQVSQWGLSAWFALEAARGPGLASIVERIGKTPVPDGGWEQNPLASAPKVVDRAAKHLGVSRDAAAVYLIFLVALWPTPKNVLLWTGWSRKQLDAATEELVEHELVLEAKRERAQRGHFLPGAWEALKSPHPPMESWKLELYGARSAEGAPVAPLGRFLALLPFHLLYERAWHRIETGDVPRYEEVKR